MEKKTKKNETMKQDLQKLIEKKTLTLTGKVGKLFLEIERRLYKKQKIYLVKTWGN